MKYIAIVAFLLSSLLTNHIQAGRAGYYESSRPKYSHHKKQKKAKNIIGFFGIFSISIIVFYVRNERYLSKQKTNLEIDISNYHNNEIGKLVDDAKNLNTTLDLNNFLHDYSKKIVILEVKKENLLAKTKKLFPSNPPIIKNCKEEVASALRSNWNSIMPFSNEIKIENISDMINLDAMLKTCLDHSKAVNEKLTQLFPNETNLSLSTDDKITLNMIIKKHEDHIEYLLNNMLKVKNYTLSLIKTWGKSLLNSAINNYIAEGPIINQRACILQKKADQLLNNNQSMIRNCTDALNELLQQIENTPDKQAYLVNEIRINLGQAFDKIFPKFDESKFAYAK
ncbi:MAG: hypothetical protein AAF380_00545 [Bacteroidota bacterium]